MLADGALDFCRLWLFITVLLSVTVGMWWEVAPGTQSSLSLFLHAGAGGPALLPSLCGRLIQAPSCTALCLAEALESPEVGLGSLACSCSYYSWLVFLAALE